MSVICRPVLVLDDHGCAGRDLVSDDVEGELPDLVLPGFQLDVEPESPAQQTRVGEQPRGEVMWLGRPH